MPKMQTKKGKLGAEDKQEKNGIALKGGINIKESDFNLKRHIKNIKEHDLKLNNE